MWIRVRLFANLRDCLPDAPRGRGEVELRDGASLLDLLETLGIPAKLAQMVLVDGAQAPRTSSARSELILSPGQTISIFPPLAGG